jgi:hypothetical protein
MAHRVDAPVDRDVSPSPDPVLDDAPAHAAGPEIGDRDDALLPLHQPLKTSSVILGAIIAVAFTHLALSIGGGGARAGLWHGFDADS